MPTLQDIQNALAGIQKKYAPTGLGGEQRALQESADYIRTNNLDPNMVAQAANGLNPGAPWDVNRVQQTLAQYGPQASGLGMAGLSPAQTTLYQGGAEAQTRIGQTQQQVGGLYNQGQQMLNPFMQSGGQAHDLQAALSGALGPEAQQQAFNSYSSSPGVQFAQQEAERALLRNASATGGAWWRKRPQRLNPIGCRYGDAGFWQSVWQMGGSG